MEQRDVIISAKPICLDIENTTDKSTMVNLFTRFIPTGLNIKIPHRDYNDPENETNFYDSLVEEFINKKVEVELDGVYVSCENLFKYMDHFYLNVITDNNEANTPFEKRIPLTLDVFNPMIDPYQNQDKCIFLKNSNLTYSQLIGGKSKIIFFIPPFGKVHMNFYLKSLNCSDLDNLKHLKAYVKKEVPIIRVN